MTHLFPARRSAARSVGRLPASIAAAALAAAWLAGPAQVRAQALAQEAPPNAAPADAAPAPAGDAGAPPHGGGFWERDALTGDWGGLRTMLEDHGVQLGLNYVGDVLSNLSGGVKSGTIYEQRLEFLLNLDLDKLAGWSGAILHANAYQIAGRGLSYGYLDNNLLTASNIEAQRTTRLFDLWLQQSFLDDRVSLRLGQLAADDEFFISQYATTLVNATFGWPGIGTADLPSGGPAYPLATPGVRLRVAANDQLSVAIGAFNGDPAGPGSGNPELRDPSGTAFRVNDGVLAIAEAAYALNQGKNATGLPGTYKLGAWYHSGQFADQHYASDGLSLADPASTGVPRQHWNDWGFYGILDQMLWRKPDTTDQGLGAFLRLSGSPGDRNLVDFYADAGLSYKGLVPGRDNDVLALGLAYARIGGAARALDQDAALFSGTSRPVRDYEAMIELTYQAQVTPWWVVQPDLQFIFHPGGNVPDPTDPTGTRPIRDATIIGLRTAITF